MIAVLDSALLPPQFAFAVPRSVGGSVVRHRIVRRLRAVGSTLLSEGRLPAGQYLLGATAEAADMPYAALTDAVRKAVAQAVRG